jgi:pimeloyl-ACP methyl ester carboxylesterase
MVAADPTLEGRIDRQNVGLIGHSMGGEGVVAAQVLNETQGRGYGINGVVSIAPTHWRPELVLRQTKYAQLLGSLDQLISGKYNVTGPLGVFSGFRIYDHAWRPKTHFYIHKGRHNPFNRIWVASGDDFEADIAALALPPQDHERLAMCLINAFFQDALLGQSAYAGYMAGTILPNNLLDLTIHTQHSEPPTQILDNFGDPDEQTGLAAAPLDKTVNSRNQVVNAAGPGLDVWQDVAHITLTNSPHDTKSVELSWNQPSVIYSSPTGGLSVGPTDSLALRISQFFQDDVLNPVGEPLDLFVSLSDGANQATVRLGAVSQVPYPEAYGLSVFKTVRLPIDAFMAANPSLNPGSIQSVSLELIGQGTGHILVDDLELGS